MAKIYSFMPRPPAATRTSNAARGEATIIIFPGVRYERQMAGSDGAGSNRDGPSGPKSVRNRR